MKNIFSNFAKRLVVKCGSSLLIDEEFSPRKEWLETLAEDIAALRRANIEVLVVTSGAVAMGRKILGLGSKKLKLEEKQAAAATGQVALMQVWQEALAKVGLNLAQTLLTAYDTERRRNWLNARATFDALFALKVIPIVNENDTIATEEIRYGDNDRLAARVAQMVGADCLLLLSDIDGLYDKNPKKFAHAKHIEKVENITPEIENMAGGALASGIGSGGMKTKIDAAKIATSFGCKTAILHGFENHPLARLVNGEKATWFLAKTDVQTARLNWLRHNLKPMGFYVIDDGAKEALNKGASLLPVGVKSIEGVFERGDAVGIKAGNGQILGRGLSSYSSSDAQKIIGKKSGEIEKILGFTGRRAFIHRDDMVIERA